VIIVDDGSTDGSVAAIQKEYAQKFRLEILRGNGTLFWGGATEMGMKRALQEAADHDYIMTLNNDVVLPPEFLAKAIALKRRHPGALVGSISAGRANHQEQVVTAWRMMCWPLAWTRRVWWPLTSDQIQAISDEVIDVDFLPGTATVVEADVVRKFGTVKGSLLRHYQADFEYGYRLRKGGNRVLLARDLIVSQDMQSTGIAGNDYRDLTLKEFGTSFFSVRSPTCLKYKWRFARTCCPNWALPTFLLCDFFKAVLRGLLLCFLGERAVVRVKTLVN
jgi:GT2 family glycosyltransferase